MICNKPVSLRGKHGCSGVKGEGLIKGALTARFYVDSLSCEELNEPFFDGMMHHDVTRSPGVAILEELVDDVGGIQFAGGIVVGVSWAVPSVRVNAKGGENGND